MSVSGPTSRRSSRGIALLTVLMIVLILLILIGALLNYLPVELNQSSYVGYDNRSLYAADAGIQYAAEAIESDASSGIAPTPGPTPGGAPFAQFYLEPSPNPSASPDAQVYIQAVGPPTGQKLYYVTSIGWYDGIPHRVDAVLQEQPLNSDLLLGKNNARGNYFVSGLMHFDGPVYLEGSTNPINIQWYKNVVPVFGASAQISGNYKFYGPSPSGVPGPGEWTDVDANGLGPGGLTFSAPNAVPYPTLTDSAAVANEAFSGTRSGTTFPNPSKGIYINGNPVLNPGSVPYCNGSPEVNSGIYVEGDADISMSSSGTTQSFAFSPSGTGNSFSPNHTVTLTIDFANDTTLVSDKGPSGTTVQQFCGTPSGDSQGPATANGIVFVNGDVDALSGSVHGDYTVAVPDNATSNPGANNIILTGNITLQNDPNPADPGYCNCQSTDMLGVYAHDVEVSQSTILGSAEFEIAIFAGNSADVAIKNLDGAYMVQGAFTGGPRGTVNVFGSVVQNYVQPLGVFDPSTGKLKQDWADTYNWDKRFLTNVPPGMPESDSYVPIAWKDIGTP